MSNFFTKIAAFFSAIVVAVTGWFSFLKKDDVKPTNPPTTSITQTTKKTTTTKKATTTKKTTTTTKKTTTITNGTVISDSAFISEATNALNAERKKNGAANLKADSNLTKAAAVRAKELAKKFDHIRPDGRKFSTVYSDLKITAPTAVAENIASATKFTGAKDIVDTWIASSSHQKNIVNSKYTRFGMAWYKEGGKEYSVLLLGN